MSLETISVTMTLQRDAEMSLTSRQIQTRLLREWLPTCFLPLEVQGTWGTQRVELQAIAPDATWRGVDLWRGEVVCESFPLSRLESGTQSLNDELLAELASQTDEYFQFSLSGGLYHHPHLPETEVGWYGRLVVTEPGIKEGRLWHIVRVSFEWTKGDRAVWVDFPFAGYPLTSHTPRFDPQSPIPTTPHKNLVEENRGLLLPAIAKVQRVLELASYKVAWTINYDEAVLPEDQQALRRWEEILQKEELFQQ